MSDKELSLSDKIIQRLPYLDYFCFVDEISDINEYSVTGHYTFPESSFFYKAHFKHIPVTPGVILLEMMGQIGLVCHLIFIHGLYKNEVPFHPILSNVDATFLKKVNINDRLTVISKRIYYRHETLKSDVELYNSSNELCVIKRAQLKLVYD